MILMTTRPIPWFIRLASGHLDKRVPYHLFASLLEAVVQ